MPGRAQLGRTEKHPVAVHTSAASATNRYGQHIATRGTCPSVLRVNRIACVIQKQKPRCIGTGAFLFPLRCASIESWCGRVDSNHHGIATASPSSWCVCQFRHDRAGRLRETIIGAFHSNVNIRAASVCLHRFSSTGNPVYPEDQRACATGC